MTNIPFRGAATPLQPSDIVATAKSLDLDVSILEAVIMVETGGAGGFLPDGRPRILFESAVFHNLTGGRWDVSHPTISTPASDWHLYEGGAAEYLRLSEAISLDRNAALSAASWGLFQILGENYHICGFWTVDAFVAAMEDSEAKQLEAFAEFVQSEGLDSHLKAHDWDGFARGYNGPAYRRNNYAGKLARAYAMASAQGAPIPIPAAALLQIGSKGPQVEDLQRALIAGGARLDVDGFFGRMTELAVMAAQAAHGLATDGVVGPKTAAALKLEL